MKQNLNRSEQPESISQKLNAVGDPLKILHEPQFENRCTRDRFRTLLKQSELFKITDC